MATKKIDTSADRKAPASSYTGTEKEIKGKRTSILITDSMFDDIKTLAAFMGVSANEVITKGIEMVLSENAAAIEQQRAIRKAHKP